MIGFLHKHRAYVTAILMLYFDLDSVIWRSNENLASILYIIQFLGLVYLWRLDNRTGCRNNLYIGLMVISLIIAAIHFFGALSYFYKFFIFTLSFYIIKKNDMESLQKAFYNVMFFVAATSLFFYLLTNFMDASVLFPIKFHVESGENYSSNIIYTYIDYWVSRNCGIFREPGVYQFYLNFALILYYNINKNRLFGIYPIVFCLAAFTTLSSAGIVMALSIVMFNFIQNGQKSPSAVIACFIFAFFAYTALVANFDSIFYKLMLGTEESMSTFGRYYSFIIPMQIWYDYPIFGCGNLEFNTLISQYPTSTGLRMNPYLVTNSITVVFATSGAILGLYSLYGIWKGAKNIFYNLEHKIIFVAMIFVLLFCENMTYSILFNVMLLAGLTIPPERCIN